jgi:predicted transcriptional regulator
VNVFQRTKKQRQCLILKAKRIVTRQALLQKVFRKFAFCDISPVNKAPFDFIINIQDDECVIVGGIATSGEEQLDVRMEEILSISRVLNAHPVLITEKRDSCKIDVPCVCADELSIIRSPEDLIASF